MFFKNHLFKVQSISTFFNFANLSVTLFILAVLSVISFQVLTCYFCFTQFCGAPHCLNFDEFRGTVKYSMLRMRIILKGKLRPPPHSLCRNIRYQYKVTLSWIGVITRNSHKNTRCLARPLHTQMHSSAKSTTRPWYDKYTDLLDQNLYFSFLKRS